VWDVKHWLEHDLKKELYCPKHNPS
jgi:hypothetical protein